MIAELRRANDEELAGIYVRADVRQLVVPLVMCMLRLALPRFPATAPFVDCMTRRTRRELTSGAIGSALDDDADLGLLDADAYWGFIEGIARGCARETLPRTPPGRVS